MVLLGNRIYPGSAGSLWDCKAKSDYPFHGSPWLQNQWATVFSKSGGQGHFLFHNIPVTTNHSRPRLSVTACPSLSLCVSMHSVSLRLCLSCVYVCLCVSVLHLCVSLSLCCISLCVCFTVSLPPIAVSLSLSRSVSDSLCLFSVSAQRNNLSLNHNAQELRPATKVSNQDLNRDQCGEEFVGCAFQARPLLNSTIKLTPLIESTYYRK